MVTAAQSLPEAPFRQRCKNFLHHLSWSSLQSSFHSTWSMHFFAWLYTIQWQDFLKVTVSTWLTLELITKHLHALTVTIKWALLPLTWSWSLSDLPGKFTYISYNATERGHMRVRYLLLVIFEDTGKSVLYKLTKKVEHKVSCPLCLSPCGLHSKNTPQCSFGIVSPLMQMFSLIW